MADNLPPSSADVTESGSLNVPEPSGPVMGLLYLYLSIPLLFLTLYIHLCYKRSKSHNVLQALYDVYIVRNNFTAKNGICFLRTEHFILYPGVEFLSHFVIVNCI
jgi:hypothetical protein